MTTINRMLDHSNAVRITVGKVSYYWETDESFPVIEVFVTGKRDKVVEQAEVLNNKIKRIEGNSFEVESFSTVYHRIFYTFDHSDFSEKEFTELVDELSNYGDHDYDQTKIESELTK